MENNILGTFIRDQRIKKGLTQRNIPGCSQAMVNALENGRRTPSPKTLQHLSRALNIPMGEFNAVINPPDKTMRRIRAVLRAQDWQTLRQLCMRMLQYRRADVTPGEYALLQEWLRDATQHLGLQFNTSASLESLSTPEDMQAFISTMRHSGVTPSVLVQHHRMLLNTISPSHEIYGKTLNNAMMSSFQMGDLPGALYFNQRAMQWVRNVPGLLPMSYFWSMRLRLLTYWGNTPALQYAATQVTLAPTEDQNLFEYEDTFYGLLWLAFFSHDEFFHHALVKIIHRHPQHFEFPPFVALWNAAWESRKGHVKPLDAWVEHWIGPLWKTWNIDRGWDYLNDAALIAVTTGHPNGFTLATYLIGHWREQRAMPWLAFWDRLGKYYPNLRTYQTLDSAVPWMDPIVRNIYTGFPMETQTIGLNTNVAQLVSQNNA